VIGSISQNNSAVPNAIVIMNNESRDSTEDTGRFAFPDVAIVRQDIPHNFTIFHNDGQGDQIPCITERRPAAFYDMRIDFGNINLDNILCPKIKISVSTISTISQDYFKPEKKLDYARIDLLYNTILVRKPSFNNSTDGLWDIVLYLKRPDISNVSRVKYYLRPTFRPSSVTTLD
jgi:hypothetical protein